MTLSPQEQLRLGALKAHIAEANATVLEDWFGDELDWLLSLVDSLLATREQDRRDAERWREFASLASANLDPENADRVGVGFGVGWEQVPGDIKRLIRRDVFVGGADAITRLFDAARSLLEGGPRS